MERHSVTASFNGGLYERQTPFHAAHSFISPPPKPLLGEPPVSSHLRPETPRAAAAAGPGDHRLCRRADDIELNIFDAERYFSEGDNSAKRTITLDGVTERCDLSSDPRPSSVSSVDGLGRNGRNGSYQATPTASSEASWNSKSGLLANPPGSVAVTVRALPLRDPRRPRSTGARWLFCRSCPCSGRKSVDVEEPKSPIRSSLDSNASFNATRLSFRAGEVVLSSIPERAPAEEFKNEFDVDEVMKVKITPGNWGKDRNFFNVATRFSPEKTFPAEIGHRIVTSGRPFTDSAGFSFPVLNPPSSNVAEEPPRDSLEVFRPTEESTKLVRKPSEFQRRASVLPYPSEGDRPSFTAPASPKPRPEEDAASDTSSDLFEIESLSTQTTYRRRDSLDELDGRRFVGSGAAAEILQFRRSLEGAAPPSISLSECYPPSEASVEWSVTTAEGFDRASAANFSSATSNYDEFQFIEEENDRFAATMGGARRKATGLLSCRGEKAVSVGPNPVRIVPPVEPDVIPRVAKLGSVHSVQERPVRPVQKH